jgi:hypothetical protein
VKESRLEGYDLDKVAEMVMFGIVGLMREKISDVKDDTRLRHCSYAV